MARTTSYSGKGGIRVDVNFEKLLEKIKKAEGNIEEATFKAARVGAKVMYDELVSESTKSKVPQDVVNDIAFQADRENGNRVAVKVGWRMPDTKDYKNLTSGQKAAILNYGTPIRHKKSGQSTGHVEARNFIRRAKKKARPKIKEAQEACLKQILKDLEEQ